MVLQPFLLAAFYVLVYKMELLEQYHLTVTCSLLLLFYRQGHNQHGIRISLHCLFRRQVAHLAQGDLGAFLVHVW